MTVVKQTRHILDTCDVLQLRLVCGYRDEAERRCDGEVLYQFGARKIDSLVKTRFEEVPAL